MKKIIFILKNIRILAILTSFFCLWLSSFVGEHYETAMGFALIFSFGILHGSNDIFLISKIKSVLTINTIVKTLSFYIAFVLIALALFYLSPLFAIVLFVLCSAYHFGEQHWEDRPLNTGSLLKRSFYIIYGSLILTMLFWFNQQAVIGIVKTISNYELSKEIIQLSFYINLGLAILSVIILSVVENSFLKRLPLEIFYVLIFGILFNIGSLIWGFAIYFVFWHSLPSLNDQIHFLYGETNRSTIIKYLKSAFPYWLISVIGLVILYFIFRDMGIFYALFFSFLAAVTFPHSMVIFSMFKRKNSFDTKIQK